MSKKQRISNKNNYNMVFSAIMVALATLLSFVTVYNLPMGGSVTLFSMVPVVIVSWMLGVKWGLISGFTMGLLQMILGFSNFGYVSGLLAYIILILADYIVPFTLIGLAGIFKGKIKNDLVAVGLGACMVGVIRFCCHFISGITIWGVWASDDTLPAILSYSLIYNGSYMLPETILTIVGSVLVVKFILPKISDKL